MPTPLPSQRSISSTRSAPPAKSNNLNIALLLLLLVTLGVGGYGWVNLNNRITTLETKLNPPARLATAGTIGLDTTGNTNQGNGGFNNNGGRGGGRGRGGNSAATIDQTFGLNLNAAQLTQLDSLLQQRTQLRNAARQDVGDPNAADTTAIDNQMSGLVGPENISQVLQQINGGGRGGRGGRGGNGGGGGGGGFGGGGGGFGGGAG